MHVKLKPLSHPELGEILIEDPIFPVGRDEAPFANFDRKIVANLSRRHARIFVEAGELYVADMGSRNGTRLNTKAVKQKPVRVHQGDKISFGRLDYEVQLLSERDDEASQSNASCSLTLSPQGNNPQLEALTISCFPFLIGKASPAFASSVKAELEHNAYLSRRHAHIFVKGDTLYIEDLGSTNGTYVNGKPLSEHAMPIESGDEIVFGMSDFSYMATQQSSSSDNSLPKNEDGAQAEHTVFVSSADSFLNIFCVDEEDVVDPVADADPPAAETDKDAVHTAKWLGKGAVHRFFVFIAELREALNGDSATNPRKTWMFFGCAMLVAAIGASLYFVDSPKQEIRELLDQQQYLRVAQRVQGYLIDHPNDDDVRKWGTEALISHWLPQWRTGLDQSSYSEALETIREARLLTVKGTAGGIEEGSTAGESEPDFLDLLRWITELHQFIAERGGVDAPLQLYQHEASIEKLLKNWDNDKQQHRNNIELILRYEPEFDDIYRLTFSYLRKLRSEKSVYLSAIKKLNKITEEKLLADRAAELIPVYAAFARKYPKIAGIELLQHDLNKYLSLEQLLAKNTASMGNSDDIDKLDAATQSSDYQSPLFRDRIEQLRLSYLPSTIVSQDYQSVSEIWREGNLEQALTILEQLNADNPSGILSRQLKHKRQIFNDYQQLQQAKGGDDYESLLANLYPRLNSDEDVFLRLAIEEEYRQLEHRTLQSADQAWLIAQQRWDAYLADGGIRWGQRLEDKVSRQFRNNARLLSEASEHAYKAHQLYASLNMKVASQHDVLSQNIIAETALQRRSLQQLSLVLSPALLNTKLSLLVDKHSAPIMTETGETGVSETLKASSQNE